MAGSTRKSLAGTAAAAAKRVIGRRSTASKDAPATKTPAKKAAPAKKAPATKATAKKAAPAKKAPATKATAKKAAPAKKAPAKKAPAKKAAATKTTKAAGKKSAAKKVVPASNTVASTPVPAAKTARRTAAKKSAAPPVPATSTQKAAPVTTAPPEPAKAAPAKKARKATPSSLVVLEGEDAWTRAELDEVIGELKDHHERLSVIVAQSEEELSGLMRDAGDGAGHDQADVGATSFERDHELTVLAKERETLDEIERALKHIDDGSYGVCESCGNPIGKNRLMARPHATLCLSCKQREERR